MKRGTATTSIPSCRIIQTTWRLTSPIAVKLLGDESGVVSGKKALRAYFEKGLAAFPDLKFELKEVYAGVGSILVLYRRLNGPAGAEMMAINAEGRIERVVAHYA